MAYRLKRKDGSVEAAVRRIACEQIDGAIASIDEGETAAAVHDVRKRCKKLRGLLRLIRPAFPAYSGENAAFRDIARPISHARDAKVTEDTCDALLRHYDEKGNAGDEAGRQALEAIRRGFAGDRGAAVRDDAAGALARARGQLVEARDRACAWTLTGSGWDALGGGLRTTYAKALTAAEEARSDPDAEAFHELRKGIKYHWYQTRLLEALWPEMMAARKDLAKELSEILGSHHDLAVFEEKLAADPESHGGARAVEAAIALARARRAELEDEAWPMADRLLAQSPKALGKHFRALWVCWWREGAPVPVPA